MWEKIVLNLISNAFKFTFEGAIEVSLAKAGNSAELRVRDTGVGIPAHELPRLFDRFHRVENTRSRTHEGSGIGLALVQELAKLHGGSVRVESVAGEGSTFIVSVPLGKRAPARRQDWRKPDAGFHGPGRRALRGGGPALASGHRGGRNPRTSFFQATS